MNTEAGRHACRQISRYRQREERQIKVKTSLSGMYSVQKSERLSEITQTGRKVVRNRQIIPISIKKIQKTKLSELSRLLMKEKKSGLNSSSQTSSAESKTKVKRENGATKMKELHH